MKNIFHIKDCYGCGVCAIICPKKIIGIELNKNGFYQPVMINGNRCTNCGLCLTVCAYSHNELVPAQTGEIVGYAAWSNNDDIRYNCSSGGIAFELGRSMLKHGYKACGVKYDVVQNRAEHFIADNEFDFKDSIGSKYLQSFTLDAFNMFKKEEKYFVTGTPCQIDSLRRYINLKRIEENFVLLDFFCHGVPSMLMWKKYMKSVEKKIGKCQKISWRNKKFGWHDSWAICSFNENDEANYLSLWSKGDLFYKMFLSDMCLGKACYNKCKYKGDRSSADVRVGDLWGNKYRSNNFGVSGVMVFTNTGKSIIKQLNDCTLVSEKLDIVMDGQIKKPLNKTIMFYLTMFLLKTQLPLYKIYSITYLLKKMLNFHIIIKRKVSRLLSKCL